MTFMVRLVYNVSTQAGIQYWPVLGTVLHSHFYILVRLVFIRCLYLQHYVTFCTQHILLCAYWYVLVFRAPSDAHSPLNYVSFSHFYTRVNMHRHLLEPLEPFPVLIQVLHRRAFWFPIIIITVINWWWANYFLLIVISLFWNLTFPCMYSVPP